jgi:hypothetical protein
MKKFDWTSFTIKILVKAKMEDIYSAWTRSGELERWFLKTATFYDASRHPVTPETPAEKDFKYSWSYYLYDPVENGRYTVANGQDHIQFTFAGDCIVDVKLSQKFDYVLVELSQKDIPVDELSKQEIRLGCYTSWAFYLVNLKSVYEGGLDLRNKDSYFRPMVNN